MVDGGGAGGKVDLCPRHARIGGQRAFDARDAGGAGHALDLHLGIFVADAIARLAHRLCDGLRGDVCAEIGMQRVHRKVYAGRGDAGQCLDGTFHPSGARGAGHALDVERGGVRGGGLGGHGGSFPDTT